MNLRGCHSAPDGGHRFWRAHPHRCEWPTQFSAATETRLDRGGDPVQLLGALQSCAVARGRGGGTGGRRRRRGADHVREPSRVRAARSCPLPWSCYAGLSTLFRGLYKQPLRRMLHLKEYLQTSAFRLQNPFGVSRTTALSAESRRVEDKWPGAAYLGLPLPSREQDM